MAIDAQVLEGILKGLAFALNDARPGASLTGEWSLEEKASWEECGSQGACWKHGIDRSTASWNSMVNDAAEHDVSPYDLIECYSSKNTVYFGIGEGELSGTTFALRAHISHATSLDANDMLICVLWAKVGDEVRTAKWATGFSGCYQPGEFHPLGMEAAERQLPPPYDIRFA